MTPSSARIAAVAMLFVSSMLASCATTATDGSVACAAFEPITAEPTDARATRRQIAGHNGAYKAICD